MDYDSSRAAFRGATRRVERVGNQLDRHCAYGEAAKAHTYETLAHNVIVIQSTYTHYFLVRKLHQTCGNVHLKKI